MQIMVDSYIPNMKKIPRLHEKIRANNWTKDNLDYEKEWTYRYVHYSRLLSNHIDPYLSIGMFLGWNSPIVIWFLTYHQNMNR